MEDFVERQIDDQIDKNYAGLQLLRSIIRAGNFALSMITKKKQATQTLKNTQTVTTDAQQVVHPYAGNQSQWLSDLMMHPLQNDQACN